MLDCVLSGDDRACLEQGRYGEHLPILNVPAPPAGMDFSVVGRYSPAKQELVLERRLTAILAADVAGYSRLMGADETGTLERMKSLHSELVRPKVTERKGRIVKLMGDGLLAEFPSVVEAVCCAVDIQQGTVRREAELPDELRIRLRIGVNLGDIIVEGSDLYGDGVNVASRLEGLAEPGGICISGAAFDAVDGKVDLPFEDIGAQQMKNIAKPVRVYRLAAQSQHEVASVQTGASLPPPDKPSIAVLPFTNMSGDSEQDYFVDGITEDIITALSRLHWFFVISRNTSFTYRGVSIEAKRVGSELGVRYVLEGSVRKAGDKVRITAQLIDASVDHHLWAERYDRHLEDIFAVQDEIAERIIGSVAPGILAAEMRRAQRKEVETLDAWDRIMRAHWHLARFTMEDNGEARRLLTEAAQIEPNSALALSDLAMIHAWDGVWGWGISRDQSLAAAAEAAQRAVAVDEGNAWGHIALGLVDLFSWRFDESVRRLERAIELSPNDPSAHGYLGLTHALCGDYEAATRELDAAMRLSPRDPFLAVWCMSRAVAAFTAGTYEEAVDWAGKSIEENPRFAGAHRVLTASLSQLGRLEEAKAALEGLLRQMPGLTIKATHQQVPMKRREDLQRYLDGLREAGLPE